MNETQEPNATHSHKVNQNHYSNGTLSATLISPEQFEWVITIYFILLITGCFLNLFHALALLRTKKNGTLWLILQISLVDIASFYVAFTEIVTVTKNSWVFSNEWCPCYKGTEVLINTLSIYLLICLNFHIVSQRNLQESNVKSNNRNPLTSSFNDDSNECLVTKQENRTVTIDYRTQKHDISIFFPAILIWAVSFSLSIPNYTLSSTFKAKQNQTLCAVVDVFFGNFLQSSLLVFKIVIPTLLLLLSLFLLLMKLKSTSKKDVDNALAKNTLETRKLIIYAIVITIVYCLTSVQRQILHFLYFIGHSNKHQENNFQMPPLYNKNVSNTVLTFLAMLHYTGAMFRAVLSLFLLPNFMKLLQDKIFICVKKI